MEAAWQMLGAAPRCAAMGQPSDGVLVGTTSTGGCDVSSVPQMHLLPAEGLEVTSVQYEDVLHVVMGTNVRPSNQREGSVAEVAIDRILS
jgi:hypothetical protein